MGNYEWFIWAYAYMLRNIRIRLVYPKNAEFPKTAHFNFQTALSLNKKISLDVYAVCD